MVKTAIGPGTHLYPIPAVMVTCGSVEKPNIITLAWVGTVCSDPPMIGIGVRPSRYSHALLSEFGEFVVNLPTADLARVTDYCGVVSGRKVDKFAEAGLTAVPAKAVATVIIAECPVNIECKVAKVISLGSHDLFLGEVVEVQVDEDIMDDRKQIDMTQASPFAFGSRRYWSLGQALGTFGYSAKK